MRRVRFIISIIGRGGIVYDRCNMFSGRHRRTTRASVLAHVDVIKILCKCSSTSNSSSNSNKKEQ